MDKPTMDPQVLPGVLLVLSAMLAMLLANSPASQGFDAVLALPFRVELGEVGLCKPLLLWINEGLMAFFFFLLGLEIRREVMTGQLADRRQLWLAGMAALGGVLAPALIYLSFNKDLPQALSGWAIPCATDVAFALGVLSLFGRQVPAALKALLVAIAIVDDLLAIVILATYYNQDLAWGMLVLAGVGVGGLVFLRYWGCQRLSPYAVIGAVIWLCLLKSGVHATLAGVILAWLVPGNASSADKTDRIEALEHQLHPWVAYLILPLFALANAGVDLRQLSWLDITHSIPMGIAWGLVLGKPLGIMAMIAGVVALGLASRPCSWLELLAMAWFCGIGFTMSLFIGMEAFETLGLAYTQWVKFGVMMGSVLSALCGALLMIVANRRKGNE